MFSDPATLASSRRPTFSASPRHCPGFTTQRENLWELGQRKRDLQGHKHLSGVIRKTGAVKRRHHHSGRLAACVIDGIRWSKSGGDWNAFQSGERILHITRRTTGRVLYTRRLPISS